MSPPAVLAALERRSRVAYQGKYRFRPQAIELWAIRNGNSSTACFFLRRIGSRSYRSGPNPSERIVRQYIQQRPEPLGQSSWTGMGYACLDCTWFPTTIGSKHFANRVRLSSMRPFLVLSIALMAVVPGSAGLRARPPEPVPLPRPGETLVEESPDGEGVANLPWARGQRFRTLDDYLGPSRAPGRHRPALVAAGRARDLRTGRHARPGQSPERATRAELMRRFGSRADTNPASPLEHQPCRAGRQRGGDCRTPRVASAIRDS
jgi:hypothetical protein